MSSNAPKKSKAKRSARKGTKANANPSTAELLAGCRSPVALAAIFRTGSGSHGDRRKRRKRGRKAWKLDLSSF